MEHKEDIYARGMTIAFRGERLGFVGTAISHRFQRDKLPLIAKLLEQAVITTTGITVDTSLLAACKCALFYVDMPGSYGAGAPPLYDFLIVNHASRAFLFIDLEPKPRTGGEHNPDGKMSVLHG